MELNGEDWLSIPYESNLGNSMGICVVVVFKSFHNSCNTEDNDDNNNVSSIRRM